MEKLETGRIMVLPHISSKEEMTSRMIELTKTLTKKFIAFLGFMRENDILYLVAHIDMLQDLFGDKFVIERFDFEKYITSTDDDVWLMDYSDINDPKLMLYYKDKN